jgi:hypothetical protein
MDLYLWSEAHQVIFLDGGATLNALYLLTNEGSYLTGVILEVKPGQAQRNRAGICRKKRFPLSQFGHTMLETPPR